MTTCIDDLDSGALALTNAPTKQASGNSCAVSCPLLWQLRYLVHFQDSSTLSTFTTALVPCPLLWQLCYCVHFYDSYVLHDICFLFFVNLTASPLTQQLCSSLIWHLCPHGGRTCYVKKFILFLQWHTFPASALLVCQSECTSLKRFTDTSTLSA